MRIIAGKHKGLKLESFEADNIRPTLDRAREGIFNKIQFLVPNSTCLDLFGGTGAISLEFISRGAKQVVICDNNLNSKNLIEKNFKKANETPNLLMCDYLVALDKLKGKSFDIIFLDPPFATDFGKIAIEKIVKNDLLQNDGIIIFEHSSDKTYLNSDFFCVNNLEIVDTKKYGYITADFIRRAE